MAGKSAKRRAKAAKAGVRSFELSRDLWQMLANVSLMADVLGATPSLADKCRALSERAEHFLEVAEDKRGLIRGEVTNETWNAFLELIEKFGDASPPLKAFAKVVDEIDPNELITVKEVPIGKGQDDQVRHDAAVVTCPATLQSLMAVLDLTILRSEREGFILSQDAEIGLESMTGISVKNSRAEMMDHLRSARQNLEVLLEDIQKPDGRLTAHFMMPAVAAKLLSATLWMFKEEVNAKAEASPEHAGGKMAMDHLLGCAVRFFARMGNVDATVK